MAQRGTAQLYHGTRIERDGGEWVGGGTALPVSDADAGAGVY